MLGFRAVYFSIRKPTEDERHGARPPAVRMATFACGGVRSSCARAGAVWGCAGGGERGGGVCGPRGAGSPGRSHRFLCRRGTRSTASFLLVSSAKGRSARPPQPKRAARRQTSASKSGGAPQRWIPRIRQVSDTARIGNRKQRACQRRLVRVGSPVSAACDIHTWLRQRF